MTTRRQQTKPGSFAIGKADANTTGLGNGIISARFRQETGESTGWHRNPGGKNYTILFGVAVIGFETANGSVQEVRMEQGNSIVVPAGVWHNVETRTEFEMKVVMQETAAEWHNGLKPTVRSIPFEVKTMTIK